MAATFRKYERLKSRKAIEELFKQGSSFFVYPFKVLYLPDPNLRQGKPQVLFTVSKKKQPKAPDRNRTKRLCREAYRLTLAEGNYQLPFRLGFIFVGQEPLPLPELRKKLNKILSRLSSNAPKTNP